MTGVKYRDVIVLSVIAVTVLVLGRIVEVDLRQSATEANQLYERLTRGLAVIAEMQFEMEEVRRIVLYALYTPDANRQLQYVDQSRSMDAVVERMLEEQSAVFSGTPTVNQLDAVARAWKRYLLVRDEIIGHILEQSLEESLIVDERDGTARYREVRHALADLKANFEADGQRRVASAAARADRATTRLILLVFSAVAAAGVGIYLVYHRKRIEQAMRVSENRHRAIFDHAGAGIAEVDENIRFGAANERACEILGYSRDQLLQKTVRDVTAPEDWPRTAELNAQLVDGRVDRFENEKRYVRADGSHVWVHVTVSAIRDAEGRFLTGIATLLDISARKRAEDEIRASLYEKDVLLREVHHRVKNNLAVISSLLYLQSNNTTDAQAVGALRESQERVRSMAMVHESLYRSTNLAAVEFREYVSRLAQHLIATYQAPTHEVRLNLQMEPIELTIEQAIPCGLVLNELITNALKHAFAGERAPELTISGRCDDQGRCEIAVRDNGVGLPDLAGDEQTLGLRLVRLLATQLGAEVSLRRVDPGTEAKVTFPLALKAQPAEAVAES